MAIVGVLAITIVERMLQLLRMVQKKNKSKATTASCESSQAEMVKRSWLMFKLFPMLSTLFVYFFKFPTLPFARSPINNFLRFIFVITVQQCTMKEKLFHGVSLKVQVMVEDKYDDMDTFCNHIISVIKLGLKIVMALKLI